MCHIPAEKLPIGLRANPPQNIKAKIVDLTRKARR
jgi:hypothetical protein